MTIIGPFQLRIFYDTMIIFTPYYSLIKWEMANPFLSPSHHELSLLPAARKTAELQTMPRNLSQI